MMCRPGDNVKSIAGDYETKNGVPQGHVNILRAKIFSGRICETICYDVGAARGSGVLQVSGRGEA
jgi:hypothetical protein